MPNGGNPIRIFKFNFPSKLVCPSNRNLKPATLNLKRSIVTILFLMVVLISTLEMSGSLISGFSVLSETTFNNLKPFILTFLTESVPLPSKEGITGAI